MRILKLITLAAILSIPAHAGAQPPDRGQGQQARSPQGTMMSTERMEMMQEQMGMMQMMMNQMMKHMAESNEQ
jgi:hypothetical protein